MKITLTECRAIMTVSLRGYPKKSSSLAEHEGQFMKDAASDAALP